MRYDNTTWAANRNAVGWALLGLVWSSAFAGVAAVADADTAEVLAFVSGVCGLVALVALTIIGCRLAFAPPPEVIAARETQAAQRAEQRAAQQAAHPAAPQAAPQQAAGSKGSDAKVMVLVFMASVIGVAVVVAILAMVS